MVSSIHCCCGPFQTHVIRGATIVAIIGIALCALDAFVRLMIAIMCASDQSSTPHLVTLGNSTFIVTEHNTSCSRHSSSYNQIGDLLSIILFVMVILAQKRNNHNLYLPYLLFGALGLVIYIVVAIVVVTGCIATLSAKMSSDAHEVLDMACLFALAITSVFLGLGFWTYSIVYRAYKVMKAQNLSVVQAQGMSPYPPQYQQEMPKV